MVPNDPQQVQVQVQVGEVGERAQVQMQVQVSSENKFVVEKGIIRLRLFAIRLLLLLLFSWLLTYLIYNAVSGPCARGGQHCPDKHYSVLIVPATVGEKNIVNLCCSQNVTVTTALVQDGICCQLADHPYLSQVTIPFSLIGIFFLFCFLQGVTALAIKANKIIADSQIEPDVARDPSVPGSASTLQSAAHSRLFDVPEELIDPSATSSYQPPFVPSYSPLSPFLEMSNVVNITSTNTSTPQPSASLQLYNHGQQLR